MYKTGEVCRAVPTKIASESEGFMALSTYVVLRAVVGTHVVVKLGHLFEGKSTKPTFVSHTVFGLTLFMSAQIFGTRNLFTTRCTNERLFFRMCERVPFVVGPTECNHPAVALVSAAPRVAHFMLAQGTSEFEPPVTVLAYMLVFHS
jgi:hypothetical protein